MRGIRRIRICTNRRLGNEPSCAGRGSERLLSALRKVAARDAPHLRIEASPCLGWCRHGPNARVSPVGILLHGLDPDDADACLKRVCALLKKEDESP